jgi:hypothetical protein
VTTKQEQLAELRSVPQRVFAAECLKIVSKQRQLVPLDCTGRPGQERVARMVAEQEAAERPVRLIIVKSRQTGCSTWIQGEMAKRAFTTPYCRVLDVAHKMDTAGALFHMLHRMHTHLPEELTDLMHGYADIVSKNNPARGVKVLHFGADGQGQGSGIDSRIEIGTASEVDAGRGFTWTDLHLSECAWWEDGGKALALMPAVPDVPGTSIFLESTANGLNWFHTRYKAAVDKMSEYEPVFIGWWEDPDCWRAFPSETAREEFVATIGNLDKSPYAEEEDYLQAEFGATPEQLYWRRFAIQDKCEGKIELFKQEYPATWSEAFIGSGRQVFSVIFTQRAVRAAEHWAEKPAQEGGPERGLFIGGDVEERRLADRTVLVPRSSIWTPEEELKGRVEWWPGQFWEPRDPLWTRWFPPERTAEEWREAFARGEISVEDMEAGMARSLLGPAQYVVAGDPADDIENNSPAERDEHAFNALVAINHRTGEQVAEYQARQDHDLVARHAFLCASFLNEAWLSIERTGGYGTHMLRLLAFDLYYRRLYTEKALDTKKQKETTRYGWHTDRGSKPQMEATAQALLREESHGIRSPRLAGELVTYVKDDKGKHAPSPGSFSDLLMAWMQAQEIRRLKPLRPTPGPGADLPNSMTRSLPWSR